MRSDYYSEMKVVKNDTGSINIFDPLTKELSGIGGTIIDLKDKVINQGETVIEINDIKLVDCGDYGFLIGDIEISSATSSGTTLFEIESDKLFSGAGYCCASNGGVVSLAFYVPNVGTNRLIPRGSLSATRYKFSIPLIITVLQFGEK